MTDDVLLVGSIPHNSIPEAMEMFGGPLAKHLAALPDGEVGWRRFWITRVHFQVFALHPDLEVVQRPRRDDGVERISPHDASDNWNFRVREGVDKVVFGSDWPMADPKAEISAVRSLGLSADDEARILGGNAATLLGIAK